MRSKILIAKWHNYPKSETACFAISQLWSFEGLQSPLGVATYSGIKVTELLPTSEQIKQRIKGLKVELAALKRLQESK